MMASHILGPNYVVLVPPICTLPKFVHPIFAYYPVRAVSVDNKKNELIRKVGYGCFRNTKTFVNGERRPKLEEDSSGVEVLDASAAPEHLVIMVNGLNGSSTDWRYAAGEFVKKLPHKVIVHRSGCNTLKLTFDGVDLMGERLANEVVAVIRCRPYLRKISFVAHSLGGLIARYAIALLYEPQLQLDIVDFQNASAEKHQNELLLFDQPYKARIAGLEPVNFITFATPHLGSQGNKQLPILCGLPFLEKRASQTAHLVAGRTGKHLFLNDGNNGSLPLLLQMVKDTNNLKFISALRAFKRRVAYANVNYDHMVGWRTSSIRRQRELPKSELLAVDQKYPHIVYIQQETIGNSCHGGSPVIGEPTKDLEEEMIKGLNQVTWERVDVSFHKSRQRYIAHSTIQVKTYWLNSDGADVVFHMIDNFLV